MDAGLGLFHPKMSTIFFLIILVVSTPFGYSLSHTHSHSPSFINNHININPGFEDSLFEDDFSSNQKIGQQQNQPSSGGVVAPMCLPNYEVSEGSIIRTKDSVELGARFLNESDLGVNGKEECLRLCCRTPYCNVVVFQEKSSGSCYMFDCGSTDDFRCRFTSQIQYMSAILKRKELPPAATLSATASPSNDNNDNVNGNSNHGQHNNGLNNQHETELSQLRSQTDDFPKGSKGTLAALGANGNVNPPIVSGRADTNVNNNANVAAALLVSPTTFSPLDNTNSHRCSRWQFECKSSGECIAIYNACDGIPNCPDASDESPELHCPSVNPGLGIVAPPNNHASHTGATSLDSGNGKGTSAQNILGQQSNNQNVMPGKELSGGDHIFNHKNGGVMDQNYGGQLQLQNKQINPFLKGFDYNAGEQLPNTGQYGGRNYPNNNPYGIGNGIGNGDGGSSMNYGGGLYSYQNQPLAMNLPQFKGQSPPNSDLQQYQVPPILQQQSHYNKAQQGPSPYMPPIFPNSNTLPNPPPLVKQANNKDDRHPERLPQNDPVLTTSPPSKVEPKTSSPKESKVGVEGTKDKKIESEEKVEDEILKSIKNQPYNDAEAAAVHLDSEELSSQTAGPGAVFLFIVGLGMTIVMVVVVGCRLRRGGVGARRRRKNRLDPDYLVDGMYL